MSVTEQTTVGGQSLEGREQWLAERQTGIGASEAGAILGLSPYVTPLEVYLRKIGAISEQKPTPAMKWGLRMQQAIAEGYTEETGRELHSSQTFLRHPEAPWMVATLDYLAADRPVELKRVHPAAAKGYGEPGTEEVPECHRLQCLQQMACSGHDICDLAVLIGHCDFRIYTICRDSQVIDSLIEIERDFMESVKRGEPPLPDFLHPSTLDLLNLLDTTEGKVIDLPASCDQLVEDYLMHTASLKERERIRDQIKAQIMYALGDAELGWLDDGRRVTRKLIERKEYVVKASSYHQLRVYDSPKRKD